MIENDGAQAGGPRRTSDVVGELLDAMTRIVTDYGTLDRTGDTLASLIQGTAAFLGGAGVWRGEKPFGELPQWFPDRPMMFVAHNFDSTRAYRKSLARGIERMDDSFLGTLRASLGAAGLSEDQCFFTNALMGLQPGSATGRMATTPLFREQCKAFIGEQVRIVHPRCMVILGGDALRQLQDLRFDRPFARMMHPSAMRYKKRDLRDNIIALHGQALKDLRANASA